MTRLNRTKIPRGILRPMLATLVDAPFDDPGWVFETKWDGFRAIAHIRHGDVRLLSRNGRNVGAQYPSVVEALSRIRHHAVIDGELVALDKTGRSRFQLLQRAHRERSRLRYCVFDLMFIDGEDLRSRPLLQRKKRLRAILPRISALHFSRHARRSGKRAFRAAVRRSLEGIMAKRADGPYRSGRRTREWLKIKTAQDQEAVIAGFTRPRRGRKHFGSLVLAVRRGNEWQYVGHTGTGFSADDLKTIHAKLSQLVTRRKPIRGKVPNERATTWVRPRLVAQLKFAEWTDDGRMRQPAFVGLRTDKAPSRVVRERPKWIRRS